MRARPSHTGCLQSLVLALCLWNSPQAAATSDLPEQFVSIKQFLLDTVSESQRIGAATTQALLQSNLIAFQQLKLRVDEASRMDDIIEELSIELDRIAANFEEAASMRRDYHKYTRKSNRQLNEKRHETRDAISEIDQHIAEKTRKMEQARLALPNAKSDIERDRYQMTINANQSVLHSLQTQIDIWQRFDSAQARLLSTLKISTERVDYVLFVLEKNAQVYREAANTAKLRNNVRLALTDLQALGGIESSLIDLAASWREVDQIVKEIGRQEFFSNARS